MKHAKRRPAKKAPPFLAMLLAFAVALFALATLFGQIVRNLYPRNYQSYVEQYAREYGIDPNLLYTFIRTESGFKPQARSNANALGLTQITAETFDWIKDQIAPDEALTFEDLRQPKTAVRFGAYYLSRCLDRYGGDIATAAAAYHSGWGTVDGLLENAQYSADGIRLREFPYPQMNHYVNKIKRTYRQYQKLYA